MVRFQLEDRGIADQRVLEAMMEIPRHLFVPEPFQRFAYADKPLPLGFEQTISQPYIVAFMCQALELTGQEKILEVGTGSGYEAAILSKLVKEVFTIEIIEELAVQARKNLRTLGLANLHFKVGDGLQGWPEHAPFDAIVLSASPDEVPEALLDQLAEAGRLIAPVGGGGDQNLVLVRKKKDRLESTSLMPVVFVRTRSYDIPLDEP